MFSLMLGKQSNLVITFDFFFLLGGDMAFTILSVLAVRLCMKGGWGGERIIVVNE
jgi:hypothetical protein